MKTALKASLAAHKLFLLFLFVDANVFCLSDYILLLH